MNSLSRGHLLTRVASSLIAQRSTLPKFLPVICSPDLNCGILSPSARAVKTQNVTHVNVAEQTQTGNDGIVKRIIKKYNLFSFSEIKLKQSGYLLYESVTENIDSTEFFIEFNMTDSFFSWFLLTELHVWMLMVRTMAENENGRLVRNGMIEAMWDDCSTRAKTLWSENPGGVRRTVRELSEQFNCAIIGYDEGVNGDDKVLAGALWRRFFQLERNNPEDLEKLLIYVRKQIQYLDQIPADKLLWNPDIKWLPLKDH